MIDPSSTLVRVAVVAASSAVTLIVLSATSSPSPAQSPAQSPAPRANGPTTATTTTITAPAVPLVSGEYAGERLMFRYPQTWTLDPAKDGRGPTLYLQEPGGIACYWAIAVRKVPPEETLEALVERMAHGMTTIYRDVKLRDKAVVVAAADGTRRGHVEYAYTPEGGGRAVHRQVLVPAGAGRIINVTEAAGADRWEQDGPTMKRITESVRVR